MELVAIPRICFIFCILLWNWKKKKNKKKVKIIYLESGISCHVLLFHLFTCVILRWVRTRNMLLRLHVCVKLLSYLTITTLWANSAEKKLFFLFFFPENRLWHFMKFQTLFWRQSKKKKIKCCLLNVFPSMQSNNMGEANGVCFVLKRYKKRKMKVLKKEK